MLNKRYNKTKDENSPINIYNRIQGWMLSAIKDSSNDSKYNCNMYLIESDYISKLNNFYSESKNKNIKEFKVSLKVIDRYQELKEIINNGKNLELVDINFINAIKNNKKKNHFPSFETYFGGDKIIVYFNDNFILIIVNVIKPIKSKYIIENKKYFQTSFLNKDKKINKTGLIKILLELKVDKFIKESKFKYKNLEFNELCTNKDGNINQKTNNLEKSNNITNQTITIDISNFENKTNIRKNQNSKNQYINNNNSIEESIKESFSPDNIGQINNNSNQYQITNIQNNTTENLSQKNEEPINGASYEINETNEIKIKKEEEEKEQYYENEKIKLKYEKQIGEELITNLEETHAIKLKKKEDEKKQLEKEIIFLSEKKNEIIKNIEDLSIKNKKYRNQMNTLYIVSKKDRPTQEQLYKRQEIGKSFYSINIRKNNEKLNEFNIERETLEKTLEEKNIDLENIKYMIQYLKDKILEEEEMKYNKTMLEKSIEETEKLNKINKSKADLSQLQDRIKRREQQNLEKEMALEAQRNYNEKLRKEQEEKNKERLKIIEEEKKKKLEEENKKKQLEEKEENIHKEKIKELFRDQELTEQRIIERNKEEIRQREEERKKFEQEKQDNKDKYNKLLAEKLKEDNKEEIENKIKEDNEALWNREIEESKKRKEFVQLPDKKILPKKIIKLEINEIKEEIKEEEKNGGDELLEEKEKEKEMEKEKENEMLLRLKQQEEEIKKQKEEIKKQQEEIRKQQEEIKKLKELEEKKKQEEIIKQKEKIQKEKEEKQKQEQIKKQKEKEEKIKQEQIRKQKELEEKKKLEEQMQMQKQKEKEEKLKQELEQKKKLEEQIKIQKQKEQKELEEKIKKQKEIQEQLKKQKEIEELKKQKELQEQLKKQKELEKLKLEKQKAKQLEEQLKKQKELEKLKLEQQKAKQLEELKKQKELEKLKLEQQKAKQLEEQLKKQQKEKEIEKPKPPVQPKPPIPPKPIITCKSFLTPPLVGLQNIGSTCYMNATLQCFSHTELLTNYFLNENNYNKIYNNNIAKKNPTFLQLSPCYLDLINNLWKSNHKYYPPTKFRKRLAEMNPLFKEGAPNDSKDLVNYLLQQLHDELNLYEKNQNNISNNEEVIDQYNEQLILKNFVKEFFGVNKSVLSDHFFGIQENKSLCLGCEKKCGGINLPIKYNFQTFNFLILPLEQIRIFKNNNNLMNNMQMVNNMNQNQFNMFQFNNFNNQQMIINNIFIQNNQNNSNSVNIYDCFEYLQKDEIFDGENMMWCNICNGLIPAKNKTVIYTGPNILILILNRGVGIQFKVKLEFYETINLDKYIIQKDKPNMFYNLYGVVTHLGESGASGHFVAACKSPCDNKWYRFNDAIVSPINDVQSEIINFGMPYILFYKKC